MRSAFGAGRSGRGGRSGPAAPAAPAAAPALPEPLGHGRSSSSSALGPREPGRSGEAEGKGKESR